MQSQLPAHALLLHTRRVGTPSSVNLIQLIPGDILDPVHWRLVIHHSSKLISRHYLQHKTLSLVLGLVSWTVLPLSLSKAHKEAIVLPLALILVSTFLITSSCLCLTNTVQ